MQTKTGSMIEAVANVAVGYSVAVTSQVIVFPLVGIQGVELHTNLLIGAIFTVISLVRSYILRRWFNNLKFFTEPSDHEAQLKRLNELLSKSEE